MSFDNLKYPFFNTCQSKIPNVTRGPFIRQNMLPVRRYSKTLKSYRLFQNLFNFQKYLRRYILRLLLIDSEITAWPYMTLQGNTLY